MGKNKINVYYNNLKNSDKLFIRCIGKHVKSWEDLIINLEDKDIKENYDEFEYYVDAEKSLIKLTNIEKGICDVITNKIKQIDLENKYFRIVSNNTPLDVTLYNKDKEEITYHRIAKLKFSIKKDDVGVWNLEML